MLAFDLYTIDWTAIGAIVTSLMMFATLCSLYQNRQQLKELKKQWHESNRARLNVRIIVYNKAYYIEYHNSGKDDAYNVNISINDEFYQNIDEKANKYYKQALESSDFVAAGRSIYHFIGFCETINNAWKQKDFVIVISGTYNDEYSLHVELPIKHFIQKNHAVVRTPLEHSLNDIAEGLVKPHSVAKHKESQVSLEAIAKSLEAIAKSLEKITTDKNSNNKDLEQ